MNSRIDKLSSLIALSGLFCCSSRLALNVATNYLIIPTLYQPDCDSGSTADPGLVLDDKNSPDRRSSKSGRSSSSNCQLVDIACTNFTDNRQQRSTTTHRVHPALRRHCLNVVDADSRPGHVGKVPSGGNSLSHEPQWTADKVSKYHRRHRFRCIGKRRVSGNGGIGRETTALVPLSPSSFNQQATSPSTAETRFFSQQPVDRNPAVTGDEDETVDDSERPRRGRGRRRTLAAITTARWIQQLLPSKTAGGGGSHATTPRSGECLPLSPPAFSVISDDESATSDAETNLLRRATSRQDAATVAREGDDSDKRLSRDTFYSSTATDRFRLSTGSDSASARPLSSGDERYSPEVFLQCIETVIDASESCTVTDNSARQRSDAIVPRPSVAVTKNDTSTDDVNRVLVASCVNSSRLMPNTTPLLRFEIELLSVISLFVFINFYVNFNAIYFLLYLTHLLSCISLA